MDGHPLELPPAASRPAPLAAAVPRPEPVRYRQLCAAAEGDEPQAEGYRILVPRSSAWIHLDGQPDRIAGPCVALFLGPADRVRRSRLSESQFIADELRVPASLVACCQRSVGGDPTGTEARFPHPWATLPAPLYIELRRLLLAAPTASALAGWSHGCLRHATGEWRRGGRARPPRPPRDPARPELAQALAAELEAHWQRNVSLNELSARFGLSSFHLLRACRRSFGMTPHHYLLQLRLRRSLDWLEDGRQRIVDVAVALGFCSHGHFSAAFRQLFGIAPVEFTGYRRAPRTRQQAPSGQRPTLQC